MWQRLLAVAVCMMNDRHCDPVWPIDTTVDPRYPCQADADFGTFGRLFTNNSVTVMFQYQIEMLTSHNNNNNNNTTTAAGPPPSTMAIRQVERALSNVLANSFFECRRRRRGLVRRSSRTTRLNHRNLQQAMPLDMLVGISAAPADRVYPGVPCALPTTSPTNHCYMVGGGFTIYGTPDGRDISWVEGVAHMVTEDAMTEGVLNGASPEILQVRFVGDGALLTVAPISTMSPTTIVSPPSPPPFTQAPMASPTTRAPTTLPPTAALTTVSPTQTPTQSPTTSSPTVAPTAAKSLSPSVAHSQAPTITNLQVKAVNGDSDTNRIFPWWYIVAAGGTVLLGVSGGSLWYAKQRKTRRRRMSNDSDQIGGFPQPPPPAAQRTGAASF